MALILVFTGRVRRHVQRTIQTNAGARASGVNLTRHLLVREARRLGFHGNTNVHLGMNRVTFDTIGWVHLIHRLLNGKAVLLHFVNGQNGVARYTTAAPSNAIAIETTGATIRHRLVRLLPVAANRVAAGRVSWFLWLRGLVSHTLGENRDLPFLTRFNSSLSRSSQPTFVGYVVGRGCQGFVRGRVGRFYLSYIEFFCLLVSFERGR